MKEEDEKGEKGAEGTDGHKWSRIIRWQLDQFLDPHPISHCDPAPPEEEGEVEETEEDVTILVQRS